MKLSRLRLPVIGMLALLAASPASAFWVDGDGYYGLLGSTETAPAFQRDRGVFQAVQQTFRLNGEFRANDQLSLFVETRLFDDPRAAYLGDKSQPYECRNLQTGHVQYGRACQDQHQNTGEPGYAPYAPKVTQVYARYAFDYCLLDAGRRPRDWGLGMFLNSGSKPFDTSESVFDGVTCHVNLQKSQTLGFSVGYDKLAETGRPVDPLWQTNSPATAHREFGARDPRDDLDQYFFTIEYDDRKANAGAAFTKQIGIYFAQINGANYDQTYETENNNALKETGGDNTDLKFLDLYTGLYLYDVAFKNELLFRMGKSKDPSWIYMGGQLYGPDGLPATNNLNAIAVAGSLEWTIAHSGAPLGPAEFNKGDASRHVLFVNYAYAPGDSDGYLNSTNTNAAADPLSMDNRSPNATAVAFNPNFHPALLLFNSQPGNEDMIVDGAFHPARMMNATLFAAGYRYESLENGSFEAKFITATMNSTPSQTVIDWYNNNSPCMETTQEIAKTTCRRPAGFYGKNYGYELDLTYNYKIGKDVEIGGAGAVALPGKAYQIADDSKPINDMLIETYAVFRF